MRRNLRDIGELFRDEARAFDRQYGEYLSQLEAAHKRKVRERQGRDEVEQRVSILPETTKTDE